MYVVPFIHNFLEQTRKKLKLPFIFVKWKIAQTVSPEMCVYFSHVWLSYISSPWEMYLEVIFQNFIFVFSSTQVYFQLFKPSSRNCCIYIYWSLLKNLAMYVLLIEATSYYSACVAVSICKHEYLQPSVGRNWRWVNRYNLLQLWARIFMILYGCSLLKGVEEYILDIKCVASIPSWRIYRIV